MVATTAAKTGRRRGRCVWVRLTLGRGSPDQHRSLAESVCGLCLQHDGGPITAPPFSRLEVGAQFGVNMAVKAVFDKSGYVSGFRLEHTIIEFAGGGDPAVVLLSPESDKYHATE